MNVVLFAERIDMDKKNKSLTDNSEGDIILNESGTSINLDDNIEDDLNEDNSTLEDTLPGETIKEDDKK